MEYACKVREVIDTARPNYNEAVAKSLGSLPDASNLFYWVLVSAKFGEDFKDKLLPYAISTKSLPEMTYTEFVRVFVQKIKSATDKARVDGAIIDALSSSAGYNLPEFAKAIAAKTLASDGGRSALSAIKLAMKANAGEAFQAIVDVVQTAGAVDQQALWWKIFQNSSKYAAPCAANSFATSDIDPVQTTTDRNRKAKEGKYSVLNVYLHDMGALLINYIIVNCQYEGLEKLPAREFVARKLREEGLTIDPADESAVREAAKSYLLGNLNKINNIIKCIHPLFQAEKLFIPDESDQKHDILGKTAYLLHEIDLHVSQIKEGEESRKTSIEAAIKIQKAGRAYVAQNEGKQEVDAEAKVEDSFKHLEILLSKCIAMEDKLVELASTHFLSEGSKCKEAFARIHDHSFDTKSAATDVSHMTVLTAIMPIRDSVDGGVTLMSMLPDIEAWGNEFLT